MPRRPLPIRTAVGLSIALLAVVGCGGDARPPVYPVAGRVLVDGKPAAKALITFHRTPSSPGDEIPYAEADAEGAFRPSTRLTGDGAPAGDYAVTIAWPEIKVDHGEEVAGRDRLGGRYDAAEKSQIRVTVREGENALPPFELKSR